MSVAYDSVDVSAIMGPGLYFLLQGETCVYVGQSKDMLTRVYAHHGAKRRRTPTWLRALQMMRFDRIEVLPMPLAALDKAEREWISALRPKYNIHGQLQADYGDHAPGPRMSYAEFVAILPPELAPKPPFVLSRRPL
jgi:hypothetical protein